MRARLNLPRAIWTFVIAYLVVFVLAPAMTMAYAALAKTQPLSDPNASILLDPAFVATVPAHVAIMLIVFPLLAAIAVSPWICVAFGRLPGRRARLSA